MMSHVRRSRDAVALLVVVGVLAVLASLAVSFAKFMSMEREAAKVRSDEVQAKFCAWAGMEHAIQDVRKASKQPFDSPDVSWFYRGLPGRDAGNGVPLDQATEPSLEKGTTRWGRPYSGMLPGTYEEEGDTYVLKALDAASMINLNTPIDARRAMRDQPLVLILESLSRAITLYEPYRSAYPGDSLGPLYDSSGRSMAQSILAYRQTLSGGRFEAKRQLFDIPGLGLTPAKFLYVEDYLTVNSWADPTSIAPMDPSLVPADGTLVYGRVPTGTPIHLARSPVNLNTAPPEVLIAVFTGIQALWIDRSISRSGTPEYLSTGKATWTTPVSFNAARSLAEALVARRRTNPFRNWKDFRDFVVASGALADDRQKAALLSNCDPNVNTHRANPDLVLWRDIDKFDLLQSTTEISFNSCGVFEIESLGRVTFNGGEIRAQAKLRAVATLFDIYRETTQSQFHAGTLKKRIVKTPIIYEIRYAILSEGSATVRGTPDFTGKAGGIHTNRDLTLIGGPKFSQDATASGAYDANAGNPQIGGNSGGGFDTEPIPALNPNDYRCHADYIFQADGTVVNQAGQVVGTGSYRGFSFQAGDWRWNSGDTTSGTYYFEGNVEIQGNTGGATWKVSIFATGHIGLRGSPKISPNDPSGITFLAGTDVSIQGTAAGGGTVLQGVFYASEQFEYSGTVQITGGTLAKNAGASDGYVTANKVDGTVKVHYDGGKTVVNGYEEDEVENLSRYPDANSIAYVNGQPVNLSEYNDYDGWIGLAPLPTSKAYLGGLPYRDRLLANWDGANGLDADFGGGSLALARDGSGPLLAPVAGPNVAGHLLRDGLYSEQAAVGAFEAVDNVGPELGTISFWFKPSWDAASTRPYHLYSMSQGAAGGPQQPFHLLWTGRSSIFGNDVTAFRFGRYDGTPPRIRYLLDTGWRPPAHEWCHVVLVYDFQEPESTRAIAFFVNGQPLPTTTNMSTSDSSTLDPGQQQTAPITPGNLMRLGERDTLPAYDSQTGAAPEGTYDGFMALGRKEDAAWAFTLYREGRYYSGGDAIYTSKDLPIPGGSDILHASWTVHYPEPWTGPAVRIELLVGGTVAKWTTDPSGIVGSVDEVGGVVSYRLVFQDPGGAAQGAPFYASPIVDDVTIAFVREPRIHFWEE